MNKKFTQGEIEYQLQNKKKPVNLETPHGVNKTTLISVFLNNKHCLRIVL